MADAFTPRFVDLVRNYTTSVGTGDFALGPAVNGYIGFAAALNAGDAFYYSCVGVDKPAEHEVGRGTLTASGTISRDPISGTRTNFTSGTKSIALITAAEWFEKTDGALGATPTAAHRSELAGATGASVYLCESGREGRFIFEASDLSVQVAADSAQGIHVVATSDPSGASGAWVRKFNGAVRPEWFGVTEGAASGANAAANDAAMTAMLSCLGALGKNSSANFRGLSDVQFGVGTYEFSAPIDLTTGSINIAGRGMGHVGMLVVAGSTKLKFYGSSGIRIQSTNTSSDAALDGALHQGADRSLIRDLGIEGDFATAEAEYHGLHIRGSADLRNVCVANFAGDAIRVEANVAAPGGNACSSTFVNCHGWGSRNGMLFTGNNTGSSSVFGGTFNSNRAFGIDSSGSIGSMFYGVETSKNGTVANNDGVTIGASCVSYNGNRYFAISGQEAGASTNAPSGTSADNAYWAYYVAGAPTSGIPAWTSGMAVRAGGTARGAGTNLFSGCYAEANNQGKFQGQQTDLVLGGKLANWCWTNGSGSTQGFAVLRGGSNNFLTTLGAFQTLSGSVDVRVGDQNGNPSGRILFGSEPTQAPTGYSLFFNSNDVFFSYAGSITAQAFRITGPSTTQQFGTGANVAQGFYPPKLYLGTNVTNARQISVDTAAPASGAHAAGEFVFCRLGTPGLIGWRSLAAGTPGTWEAVYSGYGTSGIGYAPGAGGTVIQATSKSTGVTLNKLSGQITTNAAALPAGASAAFTLTNSQIGPTDTVAVTVASGATSGSYIAQVEATAAGSCRIQLRNVSAGALSEAVVLNFAVIKAANA